MNRLVIFLRDQHGYVRALIDVMPDWEDYDKLIAYLITNYQAKILESYDGPDARRSVINIDKKIIELVHSDGYGNYLLAPVKDKDSESIVYQIGQGIENWIKNLQNMKDL